MSCRLSEFDEDLSGPRELGELSGVLIAVNRVLSTTHVVQRTPSFSRLFRECPEGYDGGGPFAAKRIVLSFKSSDPVGDALGHGIKVTDFSVDLSPELSEPPCRVGLADGRYAHEDDQGREQEENGVEDAFCG